MLSPVSACDYAQRKLNTIASADTTGPFQSLQFAQQETGMHVPHERLGDVGHCGRLIYQLIKQSFLARLLLK